MRFATFMTSGRVQASGSPTGASATMGSSTRSKPFRRDGVRLCAFKLRLQTFMCWSWSSRRHARMTTRVVGVRSTVFARAGDDNFRAKRGMQMTAQTDGRSVGRKDLFVVVRDVEVINLRGKASESASSPFHGLTLETSLIRNELPSHSLPVALALSTYYLVGRRCWSIRWEQMERGNREVLYPRVANARARRAPRYWGTVR